MAIGKDKAKIVTFIPKDLKNQLQQTALKENKSLSRVTKELLEEGLDQYKKEK